jgi:hypothetical protein
LTRPEPLAYARSVSGIMKKNPWGWFVLLAAQAVLLGGCATSSLWETGRFSRFREPAVPSNLSLYYSSEARDVLVLYDESREGSDGVCRRAYWLERNASSVLNARPPHFVSRKEAEGLPGIPLVDSQPAVAAPSLEGLRAVASTNSPGFTLFSPEKELAYHQLPVYPDSSGTVKQVLLTPFAVVVDLTIVGGVIVYATLPSSAEALGSLHR